MFRFLDKKRQNEDYNQYGFHIGAVHNEDGLKRFFICLLRGLMVFFACYSVVVGVVEAFNIPYNQTVVFLSLLLLSVFASLLYINKPIFYIGYFILLFGFTYCLGYFYFYANSGFQALTNIIYEAYSDHFNLLTLREAHEYITNRYLTVTVAMIFVGAFMAILLNVTISGYMNLLETILITFPLLEIAFYIDKRPPLYCMVLLIATYLCVGIQQASKYFKMQVKGKHTPEYLRFRRKKKTLYTYQSSAKGTLQTLVFSLVLSAVIGLCFYPSYYSEVPIQPTNAIKEKTDNYVKIFVQSGFTGLFDRYESTGGLNNGRLGGVSEIRPDFETDLTVTFAPYSYHTVYLKSFIGSHYSGNQWFTPAYLYTCPEAIEAVPQDVLDSWAAVSSETYVYMDGDTIRAYDNMYMLESDSHGKMEIQLLDSNAAFLPYYATGNDSISNHGPDNGAYTADGIKISEGTIAANGDTPTSSTPAVTLTYSPYLGHYDEDVESYDLPDYYDYYVNEFCLQIPEELKPVLEEYCADNDFPGIATGTFTDGPTDPEAINAYRLEVAQAIYEHYVAEFDYTMSPGTTPYRQDFVEYFLTTQKRGVCAHFAASGTMLLRAMGIPARYVEGYCIPLSTMSEGRPINEEYSDWFQGPTQIAEEGVLSVDVTDAQAHAWVEIYLEGYGFVPFEMTPPDFMDESNTAGMDWAGIFGNLFNFDFNVQGMPEGDVVIDEEILPEDMPFLSFSFGNVAAPMLIMLGSLTGAVFLMILIKYLLHRRRINKLMQSGNYAELIYMDYQNLCIKANKRKAMENPNPLPDELCKHIKDILIPLELSAQQLSDIDALFISLEKVLYAPTQTGLEEYMNIKASIKTICQLLKTKKKD